MTKQQLFKTLTLTLAIGLLVVLSASSASAQTGISLGSSNQSIVFKATGGSTVNVNLGSCVFFTHVCTLTGAASGYSQSGMYKIVTTGAVTLTQTATTALDHIYLIHQAGSMVFSFLNGATTFLQGNLQLLSLQQVPGSSAGTFNTSATANLNVTGGTLASLLGSSPNLVLNIQFETLSHTIPMDLSRLFGAASCTTTRAGVRCNQTSAVVLNGQITPSPEPGAWLLMGCGILFLGTFLRRRMLTVA